MNPKVLGLVALAVIAVGLLAFSLKQSFFSGPGRMSESEMQQVGEKMKASYKAMQDQQQGGRGGVSGGGGSAIPR